MDDAIASPAPDAGAERTEQDLADERVNAASARRGPTFRVTADSDGSWLAIPEGDIRHTSHGRLVRGWNDIDTLRQQWRAQAHWSAKDYGRFVAEFGDPRPR